MIGTGHDKDRLYYLDLVSKPVACSSSVSPFYHHCRLGDPSLSFLKILILESSQTEFLECDSCQLWKHHRMSYPSGVNKQANHPFDLVHSNV